MTPTGEHKMCSIFACVCLDYTGMGPHVGPKPVMQCRKGKEVDKTKEHKANPNLHKEGLDGEFSVILIVLDNE